MQLPMELRNQEAILPALHLTLSMISRGDFGSSSFASADQSTLVSTAAALACKSLV